MSIAMQQAPEQGSTLAIGDWCRALSPRRGKRSLFSLFADILLPLLYFLDECLCFLLVGEGETSGTVFKLKCVKKGSILVISEVVVDFLIPDYTSSSRRDINDLQPACSTDKVIANYRRALDTSVGPSLRVWIGNIESCDSYSKDLIGGFRNISLNRFFIGIAEN